MVTWGASVSWPGPGVGCFDPAMVLHRMQQVFGSDLEYDAADLLAGHYERTLQTAKELGITANSQVVQSAAKLVREVSPRYAFRLRVGPSTFVTGQVDRYCLQVTCDKEADFPDPTQLPGVSAIPAPGANHCSGVIKEEPFLNIGSWRIKTKNR